VVISFKIIVRTHKYTLTQQTDCSTLTTKVIDNNDCTLFFDVWPITLVQRIPQKPKLTR